MFIPGLNVTTSFLTTTSVDKTLFSIVEFPVKFLKQLAVLSLITQLVPLMSLHANAPPMDARVAFAISFK